MRVRLLASTLLISALTACDSSDPLDIDETTQQQIIEANSVEPVFGAATGSPNEVGSWGPVLDWPHVAVSMAVLPNGEVLTGKFTQWPQHVLCGHVDDGRWPRTGQRRS